MTYHVQFDKMTSLCPLRNNREWNPECFQRIIYSVSIMHFYCSQKDLYCSIGWMLGQSPGIIASNFSIHQQTSVTANATIQQIIINTRVCFFHTIHYCVLRPLPIR